MDGLHGQQDLDVRAAAGQIARLFDKDFQLAQNKRHYLFDVLHGCLVRLLVEVFVHESQDWHHRLESCGPLVRPQHLVFLQARADRLQQRV